MSREIRFRVWDIYKKVFIPEDVYGIVTTSFGAFGVMIKDWEEYKEGEYFYTNSQIPSEFTGMKDKKGVDIYEGDIVKFHDHPTGVEDGTGAVYWKDGKWMVEWSIIPLGDFGSDWTEVVGNLYQNRELIQK